MASRRALRAAPCSSSMRLLSLCTLSLMADMLPRKTSRGNQQEGTPARAGRSVDRDPAAPGGIAAQRLLEDAESAEVRVGPLVDQDKLALAAEGTGRTVVLQRNLGRHRLQVT